METKKCARCGQEKPVSEFRKCRNGLQSNCKDCQRDYLREYRSKKNGNTQPTLQPVKAESKPPVVNESLLMPPAAEPQAYVKFAPKLAEAGLRELEQWGLDKIPGRLLLLAMRHRGYRGEVELVTVQKVVI